MNHLNDPARRASQGSSGSPVSGEYLGSGAVLERRRAAWI